MNAGVDSGAANPDSKNRESSTATGRIRPVTD